MGKMFIRELTSQDELWVCDDCGQEGIRANGRSITTNRNELVIWFCYNCVERVKREL
jgi:ribosomal protein L37AE/L43A